MNISITRSQLFFTIIKTQIGIGLLSLPSETQSSAKGDAWISVLVAGCLIQLLLLIYWALFRRFPNDTLRQMIMRMFGSYLGKGLNLIYYAFFIMIAGYACTLYVRLIQDWMLPLTPTWVLLLFIIATGMYLAVENLRVIARFFVLSSVMFIILLLLSLLTFSNEIHISNIMPVGHSGAGQILHGVRQTFFSMLGFEVILVFFSQVDGRPRGLLRISSFSNIMVTLFYAYFVFICLINFNSKALEQVNEPVLFLFKGFTNQLFDGLDLIFLTIWIIPMTATIISYLSMAGYSLAASQSTYRVIVRISGILVYIIGLYLTTVENLDPFSTWLESGYLLMIAVIPLLMWLMSFVIKNSGNRGAA
ncbi:GerAB/ArcD/ProY family transporter [Paenibacillus sp. H1-7]|uniref:GerAB/ArcD/ProY family transporter n=1 Tax=Paenibacillus sp. H1-7 TaxID=2282849 RepID=UPI001EF7B782|nr:GerAB/ArcD/ProY family transporter [Paenibacillus sp. H1-7]